MGSLWRHLAAISAGDRRRGRPVDKIRNFEEIYKEYEMLGVRIINYCSSQLFRASILVGGESVINGAYPV